MDSDARLAISKARARMLTHLEPFYAHIALLLELKEDNDHFCGTGYTDGSVLAYNAEWIKKLTSQQTVGFVLHESLHNALLHVGDSRRGFRDPILWMMAIDFAVNDFVVEASKRNPDKVAIPPDGLYDQKYHKWNAEKIYDDLFKQYAGGRKKPRGVGGFPGDGGNSKKDKNVCGAGDQKLSSSDVEKLRRKVVAIAEQLKAQGDLPGDFDELIDKLKPKVD